MIHKAGVAPPAAARSRPRGWSDCRWLSLPAAVACAMLAAATSPAATASPQPISSPSPLTRADCGGAELPGLESSVSIAVDPTDADHLVAAWSQDRVAAVVTASSRDGGANWGRSLPAGMKTCSPDEPARLTEPRVVITGDGTALVATFIRDELTTGIGRILVRRRARGAALQWPSLAAGADGSLYAAWLRSQPAAAAGAGRRARAGERASES